MNYLFICNGNVARSQEAECFFNEFRKSDNDSAQSAGINVKIGKPIDPLVVAVMNERGHDLSGAVRKLVDEAMVQTADRIISFKPLSELPAYIQDRVKDITIWNVPDPQHQPIEFHRQVRDKIKSLVSELTRA